MSSARKSKMARQLDFGISELGDKTQELLDSMNQAKQQGIDFKMFSTLL